MGKQITYLLGAGASAETIPVVGQMHKRIIFVLDRLRIIEQDAISARGVVNSLSYNKLKKIIDNLPVFSQILSDFEWLCNMSGQYFSIDTLAKKFYLTNDATSYERLKKCLITYFIIEQYFFLEHDKREINDSGFLKNEIDKRYDSFIAAIGKRTNEGLKLDADIQILSWNYDIQFELSLKRYTNGTVKKIKYDFNILPLLYSENEPATMERNGFCLVKLNGNAIYSSDSTNLTTIFDSQSLHSSDKHSVLLVQLDNFLKDYQKIDFDDNLAMRYLNFAWEKNSDFNGRKHDGYEKIIQQAENIAEETEILVVIGYSFPIFNRETDSFLLSKMTKLKKVYIQDKDPDKIKSTMVNAFERLQDVETEDDYGSIRIKSGIAYQLETSLDQFVIPYELFGSFTHSISPAI